MSVLTLIPKTCALAWFRRDRLSRKVHNSLVQTELKAAGKNASTTGRPLRLLSVTGSRSWFIRVKSGACPPSITAM